MNKSDNLYVKKYAKLYYWIRPKHQKTVTPGPEGVTEDKAKSSKNKDEFEYNNFDGLIAC